STIKAMAPREARNTWLARSSRKADAKKGNTASRTSKTASALISHRVSIKARSCAYALRKWPLARGRLDTVELLASTKQPPRPYDQHGDEYQERHDFGQQRVHIVDRQHFRGSHQERPRQGANQAVEPTDERGRECLEANDRHGLVEA